MVDGDVVGGEALQALVEPGGAVVVGQPEPHILRRAERADVAAIAAGLLYPDDRFELAELRVEADALQLFVGRVADDRLDRLERAGLEIAEVVRVADDELAKV